MKTKGTDVLDIEIQTGEDRFDTPKILHHDRIAVDTRARFAMALMEKFATVQCYPDGEDSSGRQKLALTVPVEVAKRACEIADEAFREFKARGWSVLMPEWSEIADQARKA